MPGHQKRRRQLSFNSFFRTRLLPVLEEFERTRRRRLPCIVGLTLLTVLAIVATTLYLTIPLIPIVRYFYPVLILISVMIGVASLMWKVAHPNLLFRRKETVRDFPGGRMLFFLPLGTLQTIFGYVAMVDNLIFNNGKRRVRFGREVVAKTVDLALPGLTHRSVEYVGQGDFIESGLYGARIGNYSGRDYFFGRTDNQRLAFSWLNASYRLGRTEGGYRHRMFNGWFFVVSFHQPFIGTTIVQPDVAEAKMGWLGRSLQEFTAPGHLKLVHLEDMEFELRFKVLATSQLSSRYVLTPHFMRLATAVHKRLDGAMALVFSKNRMYAAFPSVGEYFGYLPTRPFTDPAYARHLYQAVKGVRELADDIERNYVAWRTTGVDYIEFTPPHHA